MAANDSKEEVDVKDANAAKTLSPSIASLKAKVRHQTNGDNSDHNSDGECNEESMEEEDETNGAEEEEEEEEDEVQEVSGHSSPEKVNGGKSASSSPEKVSRRKSPMKIREIEEVESDEDDNDDVEEVKDNESDGSDSDIMEVEAEDPLAAPEPPMLQQHQQQHKLPPQMSRQFPSHQSHFSKSSGPNIVTIDDVKTLHKLANSAKRSAESEKSNLVLIDTSTILAGKATSGVTITPAKPKSNVIPNLPSGVTISTTSKGGQSIPLRGGGGMLPGSSNTAFGYDQKGQLNDPNLTDDTFVVEAPSFIVPYVYEKPPKETFDVFRASVKKLVEEKVEKKEDKKDASSSSKSSDEEEVVELNKDTNEPKKRPPSDNFFDSSLGKFLFDLGMNLVQETVQADLLKQQIRKSQKDKSAAVMHAIMSLKKNLESSKEHNEPFRLKEKKCRFCSFRTESELSMLHHMETPHMKQFMYRCNFCPYETKLPQEVLAHMSTLHGVRGRLERAPGIHQCPQCPFEDNMKGKLTRHKNGCDKRFRPERNQEPSHDWEPPAKILKPPMIPRRPVHAGHPMGGPAGHAMGAAQTLSQLASLRQISPGGLQSQHPQQRNIYAGMPALQMGPRGRGRPIGTYKADLKIPNPHMSMSRPGLTMNSMAFNKASSQMLSMPGANYLNNQVVLQALNQQANRFQAGSKILSNLGSNSSVTIQSVSQRSAINRANTTPSISITPLPGRQSLPNMAAGAKASPSVSSAMKPGQPSSAGSQGGKGSFVICEICDGYIKDLEQLRNHMLWIHKVKIHPKMIYNRPPLNCQKCQFRFFTDQGLERHLLGSHGLVTASMQELANKGQDSGRCPVCGKVYQWKLLNHVAKDHQKTLKPAHLSYKCTVCTATFGQYKLFENHVYQAHSGAAKKADKAKQQAKGSTIGKPPIKVPHDITVIPKPAEKKPQEASTSKSPSAAAASSKKPTSAEVIDLDDEEEIDDVEEEEKGKRPKRPSNSNDVAGEPSRKKNKQSTEEDSGEEGVEEIEDEEPDDE